MKYRFYVNRGRINDPEITKRFNVTELADTREGRLLQELIPLAYIPTEIFEPEIPHREMLSLARRLHGAGHDVTVTDLQRVKKIERPYYT